MFFAVCTPIESKPVTDVRHHPSPRVAEFKAVHGPDMQILEVGCSLKDNQSCMFCEAELDYLISDLSRCQTKSKICLGTNEKNLKTQAGTN